MFLEESMPNNSREIPIPDWLLGKSKMRPVTVRKSSYGISRERLKKRRCIHSPSLVLTSLVQPTDSPDSSANSFRFFFLSTLKLTLDSQKVSAISHLTYFRYCNLKIDLTLWICCQHSVFVFSFQKFFVSIFLHWNTSNWTAFDELSNRTCTKNSMQYKTPICCKHLHVLLLRK